MEGKASSGLRRPRLELCARDLAISQPTEHGDRTAKRAGGLVSIILNQCEVRPQGRQEDSHELLLLDDRLWDAVITGNHAGQESLVRQIENGSLWIGEPGTTLCRHEQVRWRG